MSKKEVNKKSKENKSKENKSKENKSKVNKNKIAKITKVEIIEVIKVEQQGVKQRKVVSLEAITHIFTIISCLSAVCVFILSEFPSLNIFSSNYLEKANAGDSYSQIYLAHHYYEMGDLKDSIYWYKLAALRGKYQSVAYNNLVVIYSENKDETLNIIDFEEKRYNYLLKSALMGNEIGIENLRKLLIYRNIELVDKNIDIDMQEQIAQIIGVENLYDIMPSYEYAGMIISDSFLTNTKDTIYELQSTDRYLSPDNPYTYTTKYTYEVYKQEGVQEELHLQYDDSIDGFSWMRDSLKNNQY